MPKHKAFVNPKEPFTYFYNLKDYQNKYQDQPYLTVYIPIQKNKLPFKINKKTPVTPWSYSFQMDKRRCCRWLRTPQQILSEYFKFIQVDPKYWLFLLDYPLSIVLPIFKQIKIYVHTHYDELGIAGRYFVDIDAISGIPPNQLRTQDDDPYEWLTKLVPSEYDRKWWSEQFFQTFCDCAVETPIEILPFDQFVHDRWLWVTEGASKFSKLYLDDTYVRSKFGAAVSLTDEELLGLVQDALAGHKDQRIGVFVKSDEASYKNRLIANVPLGGYLVAAYIRYIIESYCSTKPIFAKLMPTLCDKINLIELLRSGQQIFPLDESAYDYHVTRESWLGFIDFLHVAFPKNKGVDYFDILFHNTKWVYDKQEDVWLKGMPSGLALTSLLNSWMNYIKQKQIVPGELNWACGDDVLAIPFDQDKTLKQIELEYTKFGSETNAAKNWTSRSKAEYLRVLYSPLGSTGYPARVWGTMMFAYDLSFRAPIDRLNENTSLHKLFFDRCGLPMDENYVARDLAWALYKIPGFSIKTAKLWLHAFRCNGGFGKLPNNDYTFSWQFESKQYKQYINSRIRMPRVVENWGNVTLHIGREPIHTEVSTYRGQPYKLPPLETIEDWVIRLNREDLPDRGPFTGIVLDPIPLPVIDFVSIANMSLIAQTYGFYSYPNLHGNWSTINSRLAMSSLELVRLVSEIMQQHKIVSLA